MGQYIIEAHQVSKTYSSGKSSSQPVLKQVDLQIEQGEFVAVMGPSGSGKSTLLYLLSGMDHVSQGTVKFMGQEITTYSENQLSQLRLLQMGFVFQHIHLLKNLSLLDNILLPALMAGKDAQKMEQKARKLMEQSEVIQLAEHDATQASGGQLQRVGICRALLNKPRIIFGDEPTGALNSKSAAEILALLREINTTGTTLLLVTHDMKVAAQAQRVVYMIDGAIAAEKKLGRYPANLQAATDREEHLRQWLSGLGF